MKITIDIDQLLQEGKITRAEYNKFNGFAARSTASLAFNLLIGFGVIAVSGAALALLPTFIAAIGLGALLTSIGVTLTAARYEQWAVLANICSLVGALLFGGGIIGLNEGDVASFLLIAATFTMVGVYARSSLLIVLAVLALSSCVGARTGYFHATYFLGLEEPTVTVVLFSVFSIAIYQLSKYLRAEYERLAINAARTGVFLVNFGFWIGSLFGDRTGHGYDRFRPGAIFLSDTTFAILWAIALMVAGIWAWQANRRWVVNVVAIFGAIHFYTQWFERLGATAGTVLQAGLIALALAIILRQLNVVMSNKV